MANPDASLNPRHTLAEILAQPLKLYFDFHGHDLRERMEALPERVRLRADYLGRLPSQLSGGGAFERADHRGKWHSYMAIIDYMTTVDEGEWETLLFADANEAAGASHLLDQFR